MNRAAISRRFMRTLFLTGTCWGCCHMESLFFHSSAGDCSTSPPDWFCVVQVPRETQKSLAPDHCQSVTSTTLRSASCRAHVHLLGQACPTDTPLAWLVACVTLHGSVQFLGAVHGSAGTTRAGRLARVGVTPYLLEGEHIYCNQDSAVRSRYSLPLKIRSLPQLVPKRRGQTVPCHSRLDEAVKSIIGPSP
jgi:hypothetical protein